MGSGDLAGLHQGASDFAFAHLEGVFTRLGQIVTVEALIESLLWGRGSSAWLCSPAAIGCLGAGLIGFIGAGCFWGYLAGDSARSTSSNRDGSTYAASLRA